MRPLIVFTPKSMLRNKAAVSDIRDFTEQKFRSVLEEPTYTDGDGDRTKVRWVLLTSWQALLRPGRPQDQGQPRSRRDRAHRAVAPLPRRRLAETLDRYPNVEEKFWVQEESATGAWPRFGLELPELLSRQVGRPQADFAVGPWRRRPAAEAAARRL